MINKLTIVFSIFTFSYVIAAEKEISQKDSGVSFAFGMPNTAISEIMASSESLESRAPVKEAEIIRSPANPTYFCRINQDVTENPARMHPNELSLIIARFGFIDPERLVTAIGRLPETLHPNINALFTGLIHYYRQYPYIGNQDSMERMASAGWFGGLSTKTLLMLDDMAKVQDGLPADNRMKFLSIGAGNGLFEKMLSAVGETVAMDVTDERLSDDLVRRTLCQAMRRPFEIEAGKKSRLGDYSDMKRRMIQENFLSPVKIYTQNSDEDRSRIIEDTFKDVDFANTVLVLSWPREYAIPYIAHFIKNGGNSVLFVRNQVVDTVFHASHLGEAVKGNPALGIKFALDSRFQKKSLDLNTASVSTVDLYYRGEDNPVNIALNATISRVVMAPVGKK